MPLSFLPLGRNSCPSMVQKISLPPHSVACFCCCTLLETCPYFVHHPNCFATSPPTKAVARPDFTGTSRDDFPAWCPIFQRIPDGDWPAIVLTNKTPPGQNASHPPSTPPTPPNNLFLFPRLTKFPNFILHCKRTSTSHRSIFSLHHRSSSKLFVIYNHGSSGVSRAAGPQ